MSFSIVLDDEDFDDDFVEVLGNELVEYIEVNIIAVIMSGNLTEISNDESIDDDLNNVEKVVQCSWIY